MRISIIMEALTGRFETDTKRAGKNFEREMKKMERDAARMGRRIGLAVTAAATGFGYMILRTTKAADEMVKFGHRLGLTAEEMRRLQFVADRTGTNVNSFASSMQRLTRNLADARDGAGPAAGALERLGMSADSLLNMSQDQAFFAIAKELKNVSDRGLQAQLAFQLLGREGQALLGMINRSGDQFAEMAAEFDRFNLALSNVQANNIEKLSDAMSDVATVIDLARQRFVAELAPAIEVLIDRLFLAEARAGEFGDTVDDAASKTVRAFAFVMDAVEGARRAVQIAGRSMTVIFAGIEVAVYGLADSILNGPGRAIDWLIQQASRIPGVDIEFRFGDPLPQLRQWADRAAGVVREGVGDIQDILMAPLPGATFLEEFAERSNRAIAGLKRGVVTDVAEVSDAIKKMIAALEFQVATLGKSSREIALYRLQLAGAGGETLLYADSLLRSVEAHERLEKAMDESSKIFEATRTDVEKFSAEIVRLDELRNTFVDGRPLIDEETYRRAFKAAQDGFNGLADAIKEADAVFASTRTNAEKLSAEIERLERLRNTFVDGKPLIDDETFERAVKAAREAMKDISEMDEFAKQAARNMQSHFADFLFDPFKNGLKGMLSGFAETLRRMAAEAAAAQILQALFSGFGSSSNPFLASLGAAFGGSRDSGGRGYPGQAYLINPVAAPEVFIPDTAGTFVPNADRLGGSTNIYQTIVQAPEGRITRESEGRLRARDAQRGAMFSGRNG